ncbi:hypothetical protein JTE90_014105 [Oedothorax gibbosus]|uniref:Galactokinase n=1 Tax=Oedothorax gibbosus TaxID=931172 RepID=A0AAV6V6X8_9ARAC|nr:hypothetical protein JTE90_014105 [Oedothorax gibbosus]
MNASETASFDELVEFSTKKFYHIFKRYSTICSCAPGRVNLIGEHTDYNNGFVLPMALPLVTVIVGQKNNTSMCHIITTCPFVDDPKEIKFPLPNEENGATLKPEKPTWANYLKGVIANFKGDLVGFDAVISTTVPVGGGLSSSAALEVASYCFLEALSNQTSSVGLIDKALACQKAEHDFLGMPCGIMDQFISFMGKKDHALLLDCRSLNYELIKVTDPEITILITNTNVRHKLAESQYSNRKRQCEKASEIIGKDSLRDVTLEDLKNQREILGEEIYKRALHVVGEIQRTVDAAAELKKENHSKVGSLMTESHISLRDNYEVSCPELDTVVNAALEVDGVYGSRMTGGGFGGCTVTLLKTSAVTRVIENIKMKYANPTFYVCRPGDGAKVIMAENELMDM